jgi:hypothetical protein
VNGKWVVEKSGLKVMPATNPIGAVASAQYDCTQHLVAQDWRAHIKVWGDPRSNPGHWVLVGQITSVTHQWAC